MIKIIFCVGKETQWYYCTPQTKQTGMQFGPQKCSLEFGCLYNNEELEIAVCEWWKMHEFDHP
jgi:hypothetical protein